MKNVNLKLICLSSFILFASCSLFPEGGEVKEKIKAAIQYNDAPYYTIKVNYKYGSGAIKAPASGEASKKVTDTFTIDFAPHDEYEFIEWKISDLVTKTQFQNGEYLRIEALNQETTDCTFVRAPASGIQLCLTAVVAARPTISNSYPKSGESGANKNAPIKLMFDQEMSADSFYYTKDEIDELKYEYNLLDSDFLPKGAASNFYGYEKDGQTFFRIISVINQNTKISLLNNYDAPRFLTDTNSGEPDLYIVVIPMKTGKYLEQGTQVYATAKKEITSTQGVAMKRDDPWLFYVGSGTE